MTYEQIKTIYLNWKGLELIHSIKSFFYTALFILSIVFVFISVSKQSYFIFGISLVLIFLQVRENNKEYAMKYHEIFEKIKNTRNITQTHRRWIDFLDKTKGLGLFGRFIVGKLGFEKKFEQIISRP